MSTRARTLILIGVVALSGAACAKTPTADTGTGTTVDVTISDNSLALGTDSISAGEVTFDATNEGQATHEFEVFQGDADPADLPIENNVANTEGLKLMGEAEDIVPGGSRSLPLDLPSGSYIVMCNLPSHFAMGLHATLTVI